MTNEKPGWWWTIWYTTEEVKRQLEEKERKLREFDNACKWQCDKTARDATYILNIPNKK